MQRRFSRGAFACLLVVQAGCSGGFYKIGDGMRKNVSTDAHPPDDTGYLTATIDIQNKDILTSPLYSKERDGDLEYLYVYASFEENSGGPKQVPLYMVDFAKGMIDETRGDELLSHYPFDPDVRDRPLLTIQTRALTKNVADTALQVWNVTKDFSQNLATLAVGPQAAPVFKALDGAANILQSLAAKEKAYTVSVKLPRELKSKVFGDIYFIAATDKDNQTLPEIKMAIDKFVNGNVSLCTENGLYYACIDNRRLIELPYVMVTFSAENYVSDPQLLPNLSAGCSGIDSAMIGAARARIAQAKAVSSTQRALEEDLAARLEALLRVRTKAAAGDIVGILNGYHDYFLMRDPVSSGLYTEHYKSKFEAANQCMKTEIEKVPGFDDVRAIEAFLKSPLDASTPEATLESALVNIIDIVQTDSEKKNSNPYALAIARVDRINSILYQYYYVTEIRALRAARQRSAAFDRRADDLELHYIDTNCDRCRNEGATAVAMYRALKPAEVELTRTAALAEAARARAALKVAAATPGRYLASSDEIRATLRQLTEAMAKIQAARTLDKSAGIAELDALIRTADSILAR